MVASASWSLRKAATWAIAFLATRALGDDILVTNGFSNCNNNSDIKVDKVDIKYNNADKTVTFNVAGSSAKEQNVTAKLTVTAFGQDVFSTEFNPCAPATFVTQLCPRMYKYLLNSRSALTLFSLYSSWLTRSQYPRDTSAQTGHKLFLRNTLTRSLQ